MLGLCSRLANVSAVWMKTTSQYYGLKRLASYLDSGVHLLVLIFSLVVRPVLLL